MKTTPGSLLFFVTTTTVAAAAMQRPKQAKPDAPWEDLRKDLSSEDILTIPTVSNWKEQCLDPMIFAEPFPADDGPFHLYGYDMGFTSAGVCTVHMLCMYKGCISPFDFGFECPPGETCLEVNRVRAPPFDASDLHEDLMELPAAVLHPQTASDVVRGIEFANQHDIGISVKVVGHSYFGASTNRGTLLIKMSTNYPVYSQDGSLKECTGDDTGFSDADRMACIVATSRGKNAFLRVGGGEMFDTAYRSVFLDWNENPANANKQYHFVGGYAGTVAAAGGWMHSGGLSGASMRLHGIGIDQVLQIEMVLPTGIHVRFGPSNWEQQGDSFEYPKTTVVTGYCNAKQYEPEESLWEWTSCEQDINFEDLWFAVRGGGGGTFGIVTSLYYQLHDKPGFVQVVRGFDPDLFTRTDIEKDDTIIEDYLRFSLRYLYLPETLQNVTELESRSCNAPSFANVPIGGTITCHNSAGTKFVEEWEKYLATSSKLSEKYGDDQEFMTSMNSLFQIAGELPSQVYLSLNPEGRYEGRLLDDDGFKFFTSILNAYEHVPLYTVQTYFDDLIAVMMDEIFAGVIYGIYLMGGAVPVSSDQMNSLGPLRRTAAFAKLTQTPALGEDLGSIGNATLFQQSYELIFRDIDTSDDTNFPGIFCHNHASNEMMGPLKTDWTQPCPSRVDATQAEREELCISQAEAFWGTKIADRLMSIKETVDPNGLFICNAGIGAMSPLHDDAFARPDGNDADESSTAEGSVETEPLEESSDDGTVGEYNSEGILIVDDGDDSRAVAPMDGRLPLAASLLLPVMIRFFFL